MNVKEIATKLAAEIGHFGGEYDLALRDYDNKVELIGKVPDPNYSISDFEGREMLFPKRWLTLAVFDATKEVTV